MMEKRILLATDGSEFSAGAIREAINIAKSCGSQLYAMAVIEINPEFLALAPEATEKIEKKTRGYLEGIRDKAAEENVECEIIIREGEGPYKYIIDEADKRDVGLIVMGRRGRTGLMRVLMGSVTARVIGLTDHKVLVVPRAAFIKWQNILILIATDGSKYSDAAVKESINVAKRCRGVSNLLALFVIPEYPTEEETRTANNAVQTIKQNAEKERIKAETFVIKGKPASTIVEFAKEKNADIIVVGSHGRTGIQKLLMGSVTAEVVGHTDRAVLVVKAKA